MACVSRDEISDHSFENTEEQSFEASEDSFHSTTDDFLPYDENLEPMANEQEAGALICRASCPGRRGRGDSLKQVFRGRGGGKLVCITICYIFVADRWKSYSCPVHLIL